jgi:predicted NodU family carbamoyl transferase
VRDGRLIAAAEEERFRRVKHWAGFPMHAIAYCLREAGVRLSDVDHLGFNQDSRANLMRKVAYLLIKPPSISLVLRRLRNRHDRSGLAVFLEKAFPGEVRAKIHAVEHHLAHLSSAFHICPFDEAAIVSIDGFGDFSSAAWRVGRGYEISTKAGYISHIHLVFFIRPELNAAKIIHFTGPLKPWHYLADHPMKSLYWKFLASNGILSAAPNRTQRLEENSRS